jgi:sirohydrochlorin ferrochelatase
MIVALIDNGSLESAAQLNLRAIAATLSQRAAVTVHAVSWKHSDRIPATALGGQRAWTLAPWIRAQRARGEREFVFVPFFISAQGAIGSALRDDLETLRRTAGDFEFTFTGGLASRDALADIVADRARETIAVHGLQLPAVIVADHGGPSSASAELRNSLAALVRTQLGSAIGPLAAASMEGAAYAHNRPLLADLLATPGFDHGEVLIAPVFLSPGRHAGPNGDIARLCRTAEQRAPGLRCYVGELVGHHPRTGATLADALRETLSTLPIQIPV